MSDEERQETSRGASKAVGIAVLAVGMLVAFGIGRWTGGGGGDAASSEKSAGTEEEPQQYTCPMHPEVRSDDPNDTCPICGMDLVEVKEGQKGAGESSIPSINLPKDALKVAKVRTDFVERRRLSREIETYGRVEVAEEAETDLTSWVRGRIEHLDIRATGQKVRRGQRIARLYSPKLESVQKELLQALKTAERAKGQAEGSSSARVRSARAAVEAARARLRVLGMKTRQIDAIVEERKVRDVVDVYAETGGTVKMRHAFEGDWVDVGDSIASLHGLDTVWVQLEVYEEDLPFIEEGTPVQVSVPARPGVDIQGRIDFIDPVVDPTDGTAEARVVVSNADGNLPPGTDVRGRVTAAIEGEPPPLSVPETAILWTGPRSVVYRYDRRMDPPSFVPQEVVLGPTAGDRRVIRKGLEKGDEVAVNGAFQLDAELQIRGEPSMMTGLPPSQQVLPDVEVPEGGKEFKPPISPDQVPEGHWYCPMDTVHWVQPDEAEECPVCGMFLEQKKSEEGATKDGEQMSGHEGHDHGGH